jgi:hypothetical protein
MRLRRRILLLGFTLFVLAALQPTWGVCASGPGELEVTGFGGSVPSRMTCGPDVRVKYGGAGGAFAAHLGDDTRRRPGTGFVAGGGAALAYDHLLLYRACNLSSSDCTLPTSYAEGALGGRLGYDWSWVGFRVGALIWIRPDGSGGAVPFPDVSLRLGDVDGWRVVAGLGAYDVPTMLRPGLYGGVLVPLDAAGAERGWELDVHVGQHLGMAGLSSVRAHAGLRAPVSAGSWLSLGAAAWMNEVGSGPEGDLGWGTIF